MSTSPFHIIRPVGRQKQRLLANAGLNQYTIDGQLTDSVVPTPTGDLRVWSFRWADIREQTVRDHMLKETMGKRGMNLKEALDYLHRVPCAVPQDQVEIEEN